MTDGLVLGTFSKMWSSVWVSGEHWLIARDFGDTKKQDTADR